MKLIEFANKSYSWLQWPVTLRSLEKTPLHVTAKFLGEGMWNPAGFTDLLGASNYKMTWDIGEFDFQWAPEIFFSLTPVLRFTRFPIAWSAIHSRMDFVQDQFPVYQPHITVPQEYWDKVRIQNILPRDEKMRVGPLEFCLGVKDL